MENSSRCHPSLTTTPAQLPSPTTQKINTFKIRNPRRKGREKDPIRKNPQKSSKVRVKVRVKVIRRIPKFPIKRY